MIINTDTNPNTINQWFEKIQYIKRQNKVSILPTAHTGQIQDCRRCGNKFLPGHLNICPAKIEACRICKKVSHFAKLYKSKIPLRPQYNMQQRRQQRYPGQQQQQRNNQLVTKPTSRMMRNINEEETDDSQETVKEKIDPESTCYIPKILEIWQNTANFIQSVHFTNEKVINFNRTKRGKFSIETKTNNKQTYWLAETGSPRSFMNIKTAKNLLVNGTNKIKRTRIFDWRIQMLHQQNQHRRHNPSGYHFEIMNSK